jgi:transcriptional regulator with XRE-family HTH domain
MAAAAARPLFAARRKALGFSQESLAQAIGASASAVARWEQGTSAPKAAFRRPLADALKLSALELGRLLADTTEPAESTAAAIPSWLSHYARIEWMASSLVAFEGIVIPALLQTPDYALAIEQAYHKPTSPIEASRRAQARLDRQAVLDREPDPLVASFVIDESVLRRPVGGSLVMSEQLNLLAEAARNTPNIEIRILPLSQVHGVAFGSFQLLAAPGEPGPYIACLEGLGGMSYKDNPQIVQSYEEVFAHLLDLSSSEEISIEIIDDIKSKEYT